MDAQRVLDFLSARGMKVVQTASCAWYNEYRQERVYQAFPIHRICSPSRAEIGELFRRQPLAWQTFDVRNGFAGCIGGLHEILRRQGLLAGRWCLNPAEDLSPGQMEEIDRVSASYPQLADDDFVRANLDRWLR